MPIENLWIKIQSWFKAHNDRNKLIHDFNESATEAFVIGAVPTLLKATVSKGESTYRHQFSKTGKSGFRVQAFTGKPLSKDELIQIGEAILSDDVSMRRLFVLGWDTLEVYGDSGSNGCCWSVTGYKELPQPIINTTVKGGEIIGNTYYQKPPSKTEETQAKEEETAGAIAIMIIFIIIAIAISLVALT